MGFKHPRQIVLDVLPMGDTVMCQLVYSTLRQYGFNPALQLSKACMSLYIGKEYIVRSDQIGAFDSDAFHTDVCQYLQRDCHHSLPYRHLVEHMGDYVFGLLRCNGFPVPDIRLSKHNVRFGVVESSRQELGDCYKRFRDVSSRKLVLVTPGAGSANRNIAPSTLRGLVEAVADIADCCLVEPLPKELSDAYRAVIPNTVSVPLHLLPALIARAKVLVSADTGPFHLAAAIRQGSGAHVVPILVWGSSNPASLLYHGCKSVGPTADACNVPQCASHGYPGQAQHILSLGQPLYSIGDTHCVSPVYEASPHIPPCMGSISNKVLIEEVLSALRQ